MIYHLKTSEICPISGETLEEERINYITHLIGLLLSLIGACILFWTSFSGDKWQMISCCMYGTTLIALYAASTFYHRCSLISRKKVFKVIDHICIYLFIAGSYTPFTLGPLRHSHGWELFLIVWTIAIIGIIFKIVAINRFQVLSTFSYILMGWLVAFSFPVLIEEISFTALAWLVAGGLSYTFGTIFYAWESLPFSHAIWHLFVLNGSCCQYFSILNLIQNSTTS